MNLREISAAVAETMGWKLTPDLHYHGCGGAMFAVLPSGERRFMWHLEENVYSGEKSWSPSTDIAAAHTAVDSLKTDKEISDYVYALSILVTGGTTYPHWKWVWMMRSATPLQRCLAFLRAMGVEVPTPATSPESQD